MQVAQSGALVCHSLVHLLTQSVVRVEAAREARDARLQLLGVEERVVCSRELRIGVFDGLKELSAALEQLVCLLW